MLFLIPLLSFLSLVNSKKVNGNLSSGPLGQGNCSVQSNESDTFNCSNGASCIYDGLESTFECTGGGSSPLDGLKDNNDNSEGPPGRSDCHSHGSHFDCDDGSFCEQINVKLFYIQVKFSIHFLVLKKYFSWVVNEIDFDLFHLFSSLFISLSFCVSQSL